MASDLKPYENFPDTPGVYLMKDASGGILYVGKAGNLKRRVSSYFTRPHDYRIQKLVSEIRSIDYRSTDTAIEALILESELIKKYQPPFNVREKDDKSFLFVEVTKEKFPRVILVRGKDRANGERFGPFTSASSIREALRILRRIFPWNTHDASQIGHAKRPCFDCQIGLCPGTCTGSVSRTDYLKTIRNVKLFLKGGKKKILSSLLKDMNTTSKHLQFEKSKKIRGQIFALHHIQDVALISDSEIALPKTSSPQRIEGYDISNISGDSSVGSMVVFMAGKPDKDEYRKFRIKTISGPNDVGMLKEVLRRRFRNNWPLPDVILIDGGSGQVNGVHAVLKEFHIRIPVVGIAKGPKRKRNDVIGLVPRGVSKAVLIRVRDEAHRFAIKYHKEVRRRTFLPYQ